VVFNVARTFGLVGGLAWTTHAVVEREKFHSSTLSEAITNLAPMTSERLGTATRALSAWLPDGSGAQHASYASLAQASARQAYVLAFQDAFFITAIVLAAAAILVWALPPLPAAGLATGMTNAARKAGATATHAVPAPEASR
jgi:DHA2 family multidrug resistance protein